MKNLYDVLNVHADDDAESVRKAFRKAAKANHPDLNAGDPDAQSRFAQIARANAILRDPELRLIYDRMLEFDLRYPELRAIYDRMLQFEGQQCGPQSKLVAIFNTAHSIAANAMIGFVLAFVLAVSGYKLFTALAKTSDVTTREAVTVDTIPPLASIDAAGHKFSAAALGTPVGVASDVKTAVDAALGFPTATAAQPSLRPIIADEPRDKLEGADAVAPNAQAFRANSDESLLLAGFAVDSRAVQLDPSTPAIQLLDSEQAAKLLQRARELLSTGDIAGARLALKPLAKAGNAEAALALGATFDRHYLARQNVIGIVGDEAKARVWYQRAMELGSTEAKDILAQMATK